jgi:hypothetical protein
MPLPFGCTRNVPPVCACPGVSNSSAVNGYHETDGVEAVPPSPEMVEALLVWRVGLHPDRNAEGQNENRCRARESLGKGEVEMT